MTRSFLAIASSAAISLVSASALAQPPSQSSPPEAIVVVPPPPPPPPATVAVVAPQNEDWNNVSHINGMPVKVGERGEYLKKQVRRTSISTNPIGWVVGVYGVSVTHAFHENVALRGDANFFSFDDKSGYEVGISAPLYLKRAYHGPFVELGLIKRSLQDKDTYGYEYDDSDSSFGPSVVVGWHWTFDSGLNAAMAFGVMRNMESDEYDEYGDGMSIEPSGYFRIGYAF